MVEGKWFPQGAEIVIPLSVRALVFGRGRDALDDLAQQVVVYREGRPVGAARLWWREGAFWLGDVGVLEQDRKQGHGDLLVRLLLFKALTHNAERICLRCPLNIEPFFTRYGFIRQEADDAFATLCIRGADVHLSHCGAGCDGCC